MTDGPIHHVFSVLSIFLGAPRRLLSVPTLHTGSSRSNKWGERSARRPVAKRMPIEEWTTMPPNSPIQIRKRPARWDDAAITRIEWGDIKMVLKVTGNRVNPLTGTRTLNLVPYEDSIHPYPLAFDPPLIEHAVGDHNGFAHHWEKLNYAFALPNPEEFPELSTLTDDDKVGVPAIRGCVPPAGRVLRDQ